MPGKLSVMRRGSTSTTAPSAPRQMSSHMNPNRSWPGVPNRYMTSVSSTVMRPKSMATVVVVLPWMWRVSSMPVDTLVIAASGRSGSISERAPTKVGLPTPNPPAMTNLTDVMRVAALSRVDCTTRNLVGLVVGPGASDGPDAFDHLGEHGQLDLDRIGVVDVEEAGRDQVVGEDHDHADHQIEVGGDLGHRQGPDAAVEHELLLVGEIGRDVLAASLQECLHAKVTPLGPRPPPRHDVRADQVVTFVHATTPAFNSATRAGERTWPARSTRSVVWYPTRPMSQLRVATTPRQLPSEIEDTNRKPGRIATMICSSPAKSKQRDAP